MKSPMKIVLTALLGVTTIVALAAWAPGRFGHRDPKHAYSFITFRVNELLDEVKATDAQKTRINAVKDRLFQDGVALRAAHENVRQTVVKEMSSEKPDAAALHALVDQRLDEVRAFAHKAVDALLEVHQSLTPAQRAQVMDELESMHR